MSIWAHSGRSENDARVSAILPVAPTLMGLSGLDGRSKKSRVGINVYGRPCETESPRAPRPPPAPASPAAGALGGDWCG